MRRWGITLAASLSVAAFGLAVTPAAFAGGKGGKGCDVSHTKKAHGDKCCEKSHGKKAYGGECKQRLPNPYVDCVQSRHGTYLDLDGVGYVCLLPSQNDAFHVAQSDLVCQANGGKWIDADGLAFICLGTANRNGGNHTNVKPVKVSPNDPQKDCTESRQGIFLDLKPLAYACLFPKENSAEEVVQSVLICGAPKSEGGQGGTWIDADGLAFICLGPGQNTIPPMFRPFM